MTTPEEAEELTPDEAIKLLANHLHNLRKEIRRDERPVPGGYSVYSREKDFVADAIEKFLSGEAKSLDAAFGVEPRRGAPNKHAKHMALARKIYPLLLQGLRWKDILNKIGVKAHEDDSTARRAIKECLPELMVEDITALLRKSDAREIAARKKASKALIKKFNAIIDGSN